jgi:hypothetical protein
MCVVDSTDSPTDVIRYYYYYYYYILVYFKYMNRISLQVLVSQKPMYKSVNIPIIAALVNVELQEIFHTKYIRMLIIYSHTKVLWY